MVLVITDQNQYVGGHFTVAGYQSVKNIAK
jgi:hypothetical protein